MNRHRKIVRTAWARLGVIVLLTPPLLALGPGAQSATAFGSLLPATATSPQTVGVAPTTAPLVPAAVNGLAGALAASSATPKKTSKKATRKTTKKATPSATPSVTPSATPSVGASLGSASKASTSAVTAPVVGPLPGVYSQTATCVGADPAQQAVSSAVSAAQSQLDYTALWDITQGEGVKVAVIDTGVNPGPEFGGGRLLNGGDFLAKPSAEPTDCDGHGTIVAALIGADPDAESGFAGVAPASTLISIRQNSQRFTLDKAQTTASSDGTGSGSRTAGTIGTLTTAIQHAVDDGASVINISAATCVRATLTADPGLSTAIAAAVADDVVIVVAAGNIGQNNGCSPQNTGATPVTKAWPAADDGVLAVGSIAPDGTPAAFSLAGPWVDLTAPGQNLIASNPQPSASGQVGTMAGPDGSGQIEGTSFSAAYVSGVVALVRARFPQLNATQVMHRLEVTADHPGSVGGRNDAVGYGTVNPLRALTAVLPEELQTTPQGPARVEAMPGSAAADVDLAQQARDRQIAWWVTAAVLGALVVALTTVALRRRPTPGLAVASSAASTNSPTGRPPL